MRISNLISEALAKLTGHYVSQPDPPAVDPSPSTEPKSESPLHALVIAINEYDHKPLKGAVPDAKRFIEYLKRLGVPSSQIAVLLDKAATRDAIIEGFQKLAKDNNIKKDDPIVIFYAGHGSEGPPPEDRLENGRVQSIVPVDSSKDTSIAAVGSSDGKVKPSIPDYVIGRLLWDIFQAKGDNITVIFDCCHSASSTRDDADDSRFLSSDHLPSFPKGLDSNILTPLPVDPSSLGIAYPDMSSHVLLAACGHAELAWEGENNGRFSTALLDLLEKRDINSMTYAWCIQHLPKLDTKVPQNPVCEGKNTHRIFFKSKLPGADPLFVSIKKDAGEIYLQAGSAQGITPQSQFEVHAHDVWGADNPSLGTLEVETVYAFRSKLKLVDPPNMDLAEITYGRQVAYGKEQVMRVHITPEFFEAVTPSEDWGTIFSGSHTRVPIIPVELTENPELIMSYEGGKVTFTSTNPVALRYNIQKFPATNVEFEPGDVRLVLASLGRWNWHVNRTPGRRPFQTSVKMEFVRLEKSDAVTREGTRVLKPVGDNLNFRGLADIVVGGLGVPPPNGEAYYGFRILNTSGRDLYAYMFQFGVRDQSIVPKFVNILPSGSGVIDPTLPRGIPLTIGYGSSGEHPLSFVVTQGDEDISIFKLFVTTKPTDFQSIAQISPFAPGRASRPESEVEEQLGNEDLWDTFEMILVERRIPGKEAETISWHRSTLDPAIANQPVYPKAGNAIAESNWFDTQPFTAPKGSSLRLRTYGRLEYKSQAATKPSGEGWFEIAIIDSEGFIKDSPEGEELVYRSHSAAQGDVDQWSNGAIFGPEHRLWEMLGPGDRLRVIAKAKGKGWANIAKEGELHFW